MNTAEAIAIAAIIISLASTLLVFFERFYFNRRLRTMEERMNAIGISLTR